MRPDDGFANWLKAYFERSTTRPSTYGPRSPTSHLIDLPLFTFVTVTTVPIGNVLCAQIQGLFEWYFASYQLARPSSEPLVVWPPVGIGRDDAVVGVFDVAGLGAGFGAGLAVVAGALWAFGFGLAVVAGAFATTLGFGLGSVGAGGGGTVDVVVDAGKSSGRSALRDARAADRRDA